MLRPAALLPVILLLAWLVPLAAADEIDDALRMLGAPGRKHLSRARIDAAIVLGYADDPARADRILGALLRALEEPLPEMRRTTATSLGRRGDRRAAPRLVGVIRRDRDATVVAAALLALGAVGDASHVPHLREVATLHPVASVRAAALTALADLGGDVARATALDLLRRPGIPDAGWSLRASALLALAQVGRPEDVGTALVVYREQGGHRHWFARSSMARLVAAKDRDPMPILRRLVGDPDERVAVTAAEGMARSGHENELIFHLQHLVPSVRAAAISGVAQVRLTRAYPRIRALARLDASRDVRWAATIALFNVEDPAGDELMLQALTAPEPAIWAEAIALLAARTGERHARNVPGWRGAMRRWRSRLR